MFDIVLSESDRQIEDKIKKAFAEELNKQFQKAESQIEADIMDAMYDWFIESPEIKSLEDSSPGSLAAQFGIPFNRQESTVQIIVDAIVDSTKVQIHRVANSLDNIGIEIYCQPSDFQNLLSIPEAEIDIRYRKLNWLEWLLKEGASTIIVGYKYAPKKGFGRSKGGVMVERGFWRVPPEFSGTEDDNFITRAFSNRERQIAGIIEKVLS